MSLYKKYDLIEVLRDDGVKTFVARELLTGRPVEVHLMIGLPGVSEPPLDLLDLVRKLNDADAEHVVETGQHLGTPYVVTLPLEGFAGLREWLSSKTRAAESPEQKLAYDPLTRVGRWKIPPPEVKPAAPARPATSVPPADEVTSLLQTRPPVPAPVASPAFSGEFTQLFESPASVPVEATKQLPVQSPPPVARPASAGEFTLAFHPPVNPAMEATRQVPSQAPPTPPAFSGEFTQLFESPASAPVEATKQLPVQSPPPVARPASAGDFTLAFHPPVNPAMEATRQVPSQAPPPPAFSGEFTQLFESPASAPVEATKQLPAQAPAPVAPPAFSGEFTQLLQTPASAPVEATKQLPAQAPPSAVPPAGEFTRMFRAPEVKPLVDSTRQLPAQPPTAPQAPAGEFTRMFQASEPARPEQATKPPAEAVRQSPAGEFTRMFQSPEAPAVASRPAAPPPATSPAGEFTRMFEAPAAPAAPSPVQPSHVQAPGEFTAIFNAAPAPVSQQSQSEANRMFAPPGGQGNPVPFATPAANPLGQPSPASASPFAAHLPSGLGSSPVSKPASVQDDYAKLFGGGASPAAPPPAGGGFGATNAFSVPQQFTQGAPVQSGPSEYTRMMARPEAAELPTPPAASQPVPAAPKRPVWLFVILGVVVVGLLIGLIVTLLK